MDNPRQVEERMDTLRIEESRKQDDPPQCLVSHGNTGDSRGVWQANQPGWTEDSPEWIVRKLKPPIMQCYNKNTDIFAEGGYSLVYRGKLNQEFPRHEGLDVAIKVYRNKEPCQSSKGPQAIASGTATFPNHMQKELVASHLRSPFLVPVLYYSYEEPDFFVTVSPFMFNSDLRRCLNESGPSNLTWKHYVRIAYQVALALQTLHTGMPGAKFRRVIVHRDVTSQNILIDHHGNARLSDYGLALECKKAGTVTYTRPEDHHVTLGYKDPSSGDGKLSYSASSDWFSYGVVLLEILTKKKPYDNVDGALYGICVANQSIILEHHKKDSHRYNDENWRQFSGDKMWSPEACQAAACLMTIAANCISAVDDQHYDPPRRKEWLGLSGRLNSNDLKPVSMLEEMCLLEGISVFHVEDKRKCLSCFTDNDECRPHTLSQLCSKEDCRWYCTECMGSGEPLICPVHGSAKPLIGGNNTRVLLIQGKGKNKEEDAVFAEDVRLMKDTLCDHRIAGIIEDNLKVVVKISEMTDGENELYTDKAYETLCLFESQLEKSYLHCAAERLPPRYFPNWSYRQRLTCVYRVYNFFRSCYAVQNILDLAKNIKLQRDDIRKLMNWTAYYIQKYVNTAQVWFSAESIQALYNGITNGDSHQCTFPEIPADNYTDIGLLNYYEEELRTILLNRLRDLPNQQHLQHQYPELNDPLLPDLARKYCLSIYKSSGMHQTKDLSQLNYSEMLQSIKMMFLKMEKTIPECIDDLAGSLLNCFQKLTDGVLWVYYTGHGSKDCKEGFYDLIGTKKSTPNATSILEKISNLVASVVIILDCCHPEQYYPKVEPHDNSSLAYCGFACIASSAIDQQSFYDLCTKMTPKGSWFTKLFVDGLRSAVSTTGNQSGYSERSQSCLDLKNRKKSCPNKGSCNFCRQDSNDTKNCKDCTTFRESCYKEGFILMRDLFNYVEAHLCKKSMSPEMLLHGSTLPLAYFHKGHPTYNFSVMLVELKFILSLKDIPSLPNNRHNQPADDYDKEMTKLKIKILSSILQFPGSDKFLSSHLEKQVGTDGYANSKREMMSLPSDFTEGQGREVSDSTVQLTKCLIFSTAHNRSGIKSYCDLHKVLLRGHIVECRIWGLA